MSQTNDPDDIGAARAAKDQASIDIPVGANAPTGKDEQNTVTEPNSGESRDPGKSAPQSGNTPPQPGNMPPGAPRSGNVPPRPGNTPPQLGNTPPRPSGPPPRPGTVPPQISHPAPGSGNMPPRPGSTPPGNAVPRLGNTPPRPGGRPDADSPDAATQAIPIGPQSNTGTPRNPGGAPGGGNRPPAPRTVPQPGTPQPPAAPADATRPIAAQSNATDKTVFIDQTAQRPGEESRTGAQPPSDKTVVIDKSAAGIRPGGSESRPGPQDTPAGPPPGSRAPESESPDQATRVIPAPTPAAAVPPPTHIPPAGGASGPPASPPPRRRRRALWIAAAAAAVVIIAIAAIVFGTSGHGPGSLIAGPTTPPPPPAAAISVPVAGANPINPSVPIAVSVTGGHLSSVKATFTASDGSSKPLAGTLAPDQMSWTNTDSLAFGTAYTVTVDAVNGVGTHNQKTFTVNTMAPGRTAYANVVPAPDVVSDTGIGVGQPMVFQFTKPVANKAEVQKHLHVTVTPAQPGAWYWVDDKDVHYRGPSYWQPGTKIHIEADVVGVDLGDGVLGAENNSADYTVHDAMVAKADGSTDQLTIFENGKQINQMPMSLGSPGFPSHEGPHVISDKQPSIVMDSCTYGTCAGQPGYYKETVALDERISNDGEFVHSAPWSVGQQGSSNVSHGCVNLAPANAQWFYDHFGIGDVVEISNSGGPSLPIWDTYGDWEVPWSTWQAGNANS